MNQFQNHEIDNLAACYLFILERMQERKNRAPRFSENSRPALKPVEMNLEIIRQHAPSMLGDHTHQPVAH
ncbi:MAG: hypothetical protein KJ069_28055 [Anaerolineae bacterium]|nr:hypothetical protein [Anaerolineae bacterium]